MAALKMGIFSKNPQIRAAINRAAKVYKFLGADFLSFLSAAQNIVLIPKIYPGYVLSKFYYEIYAILPNIS